MSDENPTHDEVDEVETPISVEIELVPDGTVQLRQVPFGLGLPRILLGVEEDEEGGLKFTALGAGFDTHAELVAMAREHIDVLALGVEQAAAGAEQ